jgi:hypothetical protein
MLSVFESVVLLTLLFSCSSRIHRNHSPALIAVQPLFSTIRCKTLNIFIKVCYSLACLFTLSLEVSNPVLAVFLLYARFGPLLLLNV